jgi:invasion protein IalB
MTSPGKNLLMKFRPAWAAAWLSIALIGSLSGVNVVAQSKTAAVFKDWRVLCDERQDANGKAFEQCYMLQDWNQQEQKRRVLQVAIAYPAQRPGEVMAVFTMPLGIFLPTGIKLSVDGSEPFSFPFQRCETWKIKTKDGKEAVDAGCKAAIRLNDELLKAFKKGNKANVVFHAPDNRGGTKPFEVPVSLNGFTAALNELAKKS